MELQTILSNPCEDVFCAYDRIVGRGGTQGGICGSAAVAECFKAMYVRTEAETVFGRLSRGQICQMCIDGVSIAEMFFK